jgi:carbamoyl-phosphate synthase large subunit
MVLKLILLSAGSKTRLLHNFVSELSLINPDFQIHVLDSKPPAGFDDKRVFFHYLNPSMWNSSKSMYESIAPYNADIILPTRNGELSLLSKMSDEIKELKGKVVISSNDEVLNCTDKYALANSGRFDDELFIDTFNSFEPIASDKIVIKERFGAGSKGLVICETKRINQNLIKKFQEPVYQNFVSGREFSADLYFTRSSLIHACSLRFRDKTIDGESTQSTFFSNEAILNSFNSLFQNSKFRGPVNVQGFLLESGSFIFFDINPRIGGAFFMTRFNGFELSKWIVQEYFESSTPDSFSSQNFSGVVIRNEMQYEVQ